MSKTQKIEWLAHELPNESKELVTALSNYWHQDQTLQKRFDEFSENTLTNFDLPYGVAPNFLINGKVYSVPMVIEESSVVAAASLGAKFWLERGGFKAEVLSTVKVGQVHFIWKGEKQRLFNFFTEKKEHILKELKPLTENMEKRGGGVHDIELLDLTDKIADYFQFKLSAETKDAMGANFINTLLEELSQIFKRLCSIENKFSDNEKKPEIIMCILSNYTPDCLVESFVECPVSELGILSDGMSADDFAKRFCLAVEIARVDTSRAVTHNKGIMNGIDAVVLATGNDFRAIEASAHAFAARDGQYRSLSYAEVKDGMFKFGIKIPLAVGTVGGLTSLHPLAKTTLAVLGNPHADELMKIMASVGLAQNFSAVKSLVTTGIQKGHMKLHLLNILNQLGANSKQIEEAKIFFSDKVVSFSAVRNFVETTTHLQ